MKILRIIPWTLIFIASIIAVGMGYWYYNLPVVMVAGGIASISGIIVAHHLIQNIGKTIDEEWK